MMLRSTKKMSLLMVIMTLSALSGPIAGNVDDIKPTNIRSRDQWGAAAATSGETPIGEMRNIAIAHTALSRSSWSGIGGDGRLRSIQSNHQGSSTDISYHYFVGHGVDDYAPGEPTCGDELDLAQLYEGRSEEFESFTLGSSAFSSGRLIIGIAGNYEIDSLRQCQINSLGKLTAWLVAKHDLSCDDLVAVKDVSEGGTVSPGADVVAKMPTIIATCEAELAALDGSSSTDSGFSVVEWLEENVITVVIVIVAVAFVGLMLLVIGKRRTSSVDRAMKRTMSPSFSGTSPGASLEMQSMPSADDSIDVPSSRRGGY